MGVSRVNRECFYCGFALLFGMFPFTGLVEHGASAVVSSVSGLPVTEFGVVLLVALVFGVILSRFGVSSSVGFILAGLFLGQQGLQYISETGISVALGEIGLLAVLFYLGLEVNLKRFKETGGIAVVLSFIEMAGAFALGFIVSKLFGFGDMESLVIGSMLVAASTVEAVKFVIEKNILHSLESRIAISVLIIQDIFAVLLVVFLSTVASNQSFNIAVLNALIFVIAMLFIVGKVSRPVMERLEAWGHRDQIFLFALGTGIVVSFLGIFLGLSAILGAYFAGFALAETGFADRIKREFSFLRELFLLFFFVSFGSKVLLPHSVTLIVFVLVLVALYCIVKIFSYGVFGTAIGLNIPSSVAIGAIMIPIGEFGILIASAAEKLNAPNCVAAGSCLIGNSGDLLSIAFSLTILTTLIGPFIFDRIDAVAAALLKIYPIKVRQRIALAGDQIEGLETVFITRAFQNQTAILLKHIFSNLTIAISVVYLAFILRKEITFSFLQGVPTELSLALLLLPLIIWPLYNFAKYLKALIRTIEVSIFATVFKQSKNVSVPQSNAFDVFAGFIMVVLGIVATLLMYSNYASLALALLVPAVYTVLAAIHLGKAAHSFMENYSILEPKKQTRGVKLK
ncbi:MAG: cation:proton antiporter [Candidatus Micrarchaeota archaeon]